MNSNQLYCSACKRMLERTEFHKSAALQKITGTCRMCANAIRAAHQKKYAAENKPYICSYLETHPCVDCGESDPVVLEFDHVRGEKTRSIALMHHLQPLKTVIKEIEKCDVRCRNCHQRVTLQRANQTRCNQWD